MGGLTHLTGDSNHITRGNCNIKSAGVYEETFRCMRVIVNLHPLYPEPTQVGEQAGDNPFSCYHVKDIG